MAISLNARSFILHSILLKKNVELTLHHRIQKSGLVNLPGNNVHKTKKYSERRVIGYSPEQLFDVVANVEHYHLFVPACRKSVIIHKTDDYVQAKLEIGLPPILESYTSHVKLIRPHSVYAKCTDGVLFNHLDTKWRFNPGPIPDRSCVLEFNVAFEFKSLLYSQLAYLVFDEMVRLNVNAFLKRAQKLYGLQNPIHHNQVGNGDTSGSH